MINLVPALGWTLLHSLWQGGLLFLLAAPLFHLLKGRSPQLRYGIACTTMLLLLGSMTLTFSTQLEYSGPVVVPITRTTTSVPATGGIKEVTSPVSVSTPQTVPAAPAASTNGFSLTRFFEANVVNLVAIWGLGVLVFTFRWCNMLLLTFRLRKRGVRNLPPVWQERLLRLQQRMGLTRTIGLVESGEVDTPLVIGYFKPIILLPIGLVNGLSVVQVEAILVHELAHVRRFDFLVNLFLTGLEVVLFYHPLYWWLVARINEEREKCCDDVAVANCGNPRLYARTLLSVEEHRHSGFLAMAFTKKGGQLQNRIQRICQPSPRHHQSLSLRLWFLLPLLGCAVAFAYAEASPKIADGGIIDPQDLICQEALLASVTKVELPVEMSLVAPAPAEDIRDATAGNNALKPQLLSASTDAAIVIPNAKLSVPQGEEYYRQITRMTFDSLPKPSIPRMTTDPELPAPPKFGLSESEVKDLLTKGEQGREELRDQTNAFATRIDDWNERVSKEYLQVWEAHRLRVMKAHDDWSEALREKAGDELTYAIAHEGMTEEFEQALDQSENRIEEAEDAIERQPENDIEGLERVVERSEKNMQSHDERMDVHRTRMSMHGARMKIHSGRMKIHSARMQIHSARMQLHSARMKSHQIVMQALETELREALIADGLLDNEAQYFRFEMTSEAMFFNGKLIDPISVAPKYRAILQRYGKGDLGGKSGNRFIIDIHKNGRSIGTRSN